MGTVSDGLVSRFCKPKGMTFHFTRPADARDDFEKNHVERGQADLELGLRDPSG